MALVPGSYARLAGVQSEVSKVTVTRVAGSEVQFRRTIDCYQRHLRFSVASIGRQQRQLRRSLRRYGSRLRQSQRDRRQRQAKEQEDADRQRQQARHFRDTEAAVRRGAQGQTGGQGQDDTLGQGMTQGQGGQSSPELSSVLSRGAEPADKTHEPHTDGEKGEDGTTCRALITKKGKLPYFKAKRTVSPREKANVEKLAPQEVPVGTDHDVLSTHTGDTDAPLPAIQEDIEKFDGGNSMHSGTAAKNTIHSETLESDTKIARAADGKPKCVLASLDTRAFAEPRKSGPLPVGPHYEGRSPKAPPPADDVPVVSVVAVSRRRAGVSYGDLAKLQHSLSARPKQLFQLVDRLASKHGIGDKPVRRASDRDPRANARIKRRGDGPQSTMADTMVKQAAVLYSIKYGYIATEGVDSSDVIPPPIFTSLADIDDVLDEQETDEEKVAPIVHSVRKDHVDGSRARRPSQLEARRDSTDVTSPFYTFTEVASPLFDDITAGGVPRFADTSGRRRSHGKNRLPLTLPQLSEQATKIRERSLQERQSPSFPADTEDGSEYTAPLHTRRQSYASVRLSPLPSYRSLSRPRRDSVDNQLKKRLNEGSNKSQMAWQSAIGRLKMLHTLHDLSPHFSK